MAKKKAQHAMPRVFFSVRLDADVADWLKNWAAEDRVSVNQIINQTFRTMKATTQKGELKELASLFIPEDFEDRLEAVVRRVMEDEAKAVAAREIGSAMITKGYKKRGTK